MGRKRGSQVPPRLKRAAERFAVWRRTREVGMRIPEPLWRLASRLAVAYGVCRTASELGAGLLRAEETSGRAGVTSAAFGWAAGFCGTAGIDASIGWRMYPGVRERRGFQAAGPFEGRCDSRSGGLGPQLLECRVMIQIAPQMKILVAVEPADFRKGIDGLAQVCSVLSASVCESF